MKINGVNVNAIANIRIGTLRPVAAVKSINHNKPGTAIRICDAATSNPSTTPRRKPALKARTVATTILIPTAPKPIAREGRAPNKTRDHISCPARPVPNQYSPFGDWNISRLKPSGSTVLRNGAKIAIKKIKSKITKNTKAIIPVHLYGQACDMEKICKIATDNNLHVVEDSCEALGSSIEGKKVGTFGDIGTFSFFMSHHITTIEGGMLVTDDENIAEIAKSLRAFGWTRELKRKNEINAKYSDIDPRFLFVNLGYNLRPTEIQGAFGRHQLKKLDSLIYHRRENAKFWNDRLAKYSDYLLLPTRNLENHVYFGYAITIKENSPFSRKEITDFLESQGIETRPVMAGNFTEQPVTKLIPWSKYGELKNSQLVMRNSFFIGNHHLIKEQQREFIADVFDKFFIAYQK